MQSLGLGGMLLFGIPEEKDEMASGAYAANGIVQRAVRALKREIPDLLVITDVCNCEYTSHGHCGHIRKDDRADKSITTLLSNGWRKPLSRMPRPAPMLWPRAT